MATIETKLQPFNVPNFALCEPSLARRQDGMRELPKFALHELSPETLAEMCDEFRVAVFAKAMKKDPRIAQ